MEVQGVMSVETPLGIKYISKVLLTMGKIMEMKMNYSLIFEKLKCKRILIHLEVS